MPGLDENIQRIQNKLQQLLQRYQLLQKDNNRQRELIKELQTLKEKNTEHISLLEQQASILKAAAGQMAEEDKKIFEKRISQYILEIDKCISLLSQ